MFEALYLWRLRSTLQMKAVLGCMWKQHGIQCDCNDRFERVCLFQEVRA